MDYKENLGVDPITLSKGYTKLDGDPPNSGENVHNPEHIVSQKRMDKMMAKYGMEDEDEEMGGFLDREPTPYRDKDDQDRG